MRKFLHWKGGVNYHPKDFAPVALVLVGKNRQILFEDTLYVCPIILQDFFRLVVVTIIMIIYDYLLLGPAYTSWLLYLFWLLYPQPSSAVFLLGNLLGILMIYFIQSRWVNSSNFTNHT